MNTVAVGASAGALVTDEQGRVLLVKPTYKAGWNFPGGRIDVGENPSAACARELREELGLELAVGELMVHAWVLLPDGRAHVYYVFDAGVLAAVRCEAIVLPVDELSEHRFMKPDDIGPDVLPAPACGLWQATLKARTTRRPCYIEEIDLRGER
ncbi:NUDIX domain-containing protein [Streptomyces sp. NPDC101062]|uniref:NUDIX domain-containing protein n=1 Tax=unclassified Streptomyces TaxID=2593676 RepID=UPI0037F4AF17